MSLRARLALVLAGVLAGPVVATGLVVAVLVPRARAGSDDAVLQRAVASASAYLEQRCAGLGDVARAAALDLSATLTAGRPLDAGTARGAAEAAARGYPDRALDVVRDGRVLASTAADGDAGGDPHSLPLASCSRGLAPTAGRPAQVESVPVMDTAGREIARVVAVGPLDDAALADMRRRLALGAGLAALSNGRPVATASAAGTAEAGPGGDTADPGGQGLPAVAAVAARGAASGVAGDIRYRSAPPAAGVPYGLLAWTPAAGRGFGLAIAAVVGAAIAACAVLVTLITRQLTRPLLTLARAAVRLRQGDLAARSGLPQTGGGDAEDEVAALARAFDAMAGRLEAGEEELQASRDTLEETLARFAEALSRTHDLDGLLQTLLDAARGAADGSTGSALLGDRRTLEERAVSGRATPSPQVVDHLARLGRRAVELDATVRSAEPLPAVAVPLRSGVRLVGALAVARDAGTPAVDATSVRAIEALAAPAGVAVANALDHEETRRLSVTDPLTGAGNFRHLSTTLAREVERGTRFGRPLSVVMLDLDHFKGVNDTHGHAFGDGVLREFARRLQDCLREVDTVARYGGEEFTVVLPETGSDGAGAVAARIVHAVRSKPFSVGPLSSQVTVSAGVASFPDHGRTASEILRAADAALYVAKSAGRDRWCLAEVGVVPGEEPDLPVNGDLEDVPAAPPGRAG